jgi:hypothetical protein
MATIDWPAGLIPQAAELSLRKSGAQFASPFNGTLQAVDFIAERWVLSCSLAPQFQHDPRGVGVFANRLAGGVERVRVWPFHTQGVPHGTLRGTVTTLAANVRGDTALSLTGCRAGANLLRESSLNARFSDGWFVSNGTLAYNAAADPLGGNTATTLTRTASGVHYLEREFPVASMANRSVAYIVWLQSGTYTGNVEISVLDGAFANATAAIVTPTAGWQIFFVVGFMSSGAAPNVKVRVASTAAGSAGDTLRVWVSEVDVRSMRVGNATVLPNSDTAPTGAMRAHALLRLATGDHFTFNDATRTVVAGEVFTYSVWLRAGTLTGNVALSIQDNTGATVATATVTPTGTWQRFSVTGTFAGASTLVRGLINPLNNTGAAGDSLYFYGEMINPGATALDYFPDATLKAGDYVGAGGQLFQVASDAVASSAGDMTVPVLNRVRGTIALGSVVTWYRPTCEMVLPAMQAGPVRRPGVIESTALDLVEVW